MTLYSDGSDSSIHARNFYIDTSGNLTATGATISGVITATSGRFTGSITSTSGTIGGWTLGSNTLTTTGAGIGKTGQNQAFWAGSDTQNSAEFRVSHAGALVATSATITGAITADTGTIGGWTVTNVANRSNTSGLVTSGGSGDLLYTTYIWLDSTNQQIVLRD